MNRMKNLAVFASGRGSNFHAIIDHVRLGILSNVKLSLLISNDAESGAIKLAKENQIPFTFMPGIRKRRFDGEQERERGRSSFDERALIVLKSNRIDFVALAGFMQVLGRPIVQHYRSRILNIHPALDLVRFGGRGMFGEHVHAAVLRAGEKVSGCTVHYVDESIDGGPIILQTRIPVGTADTPHTLAERVLIHEHCSYAKAIQLHADDRIRLTDSQVKIDWSGNWEYNWNQRQEIFTGLQAEQSITNPLSYT